MGCFGDSAAINRRKNVRKGSCPVERGHGYVRMDADASRMFLGPLSATTVRSRSPWKCSPNFENGSPNWRKAGSKSRRWSLSNDARNGSWAPIICVPPMPCNWLPPWSPSPINPKTESSSLSMKRWPMRRDSKDLRLQLETSHDHRPTHEEALERRGKVHPDHRTDRGHLIDAIVKSSPQHHVDPH